jgi:hypothetical protein
LPLALVLWIGVGAAHPGEAQAGRVWNAIVKIATGKTPRQHQQARQIRQNQRRGAARERQVERELSWSLFQHHWSQVYLVDAHGRRLRDPQTGEARRFDFVTKRPLGPYKLLEVTGPRTSKAAQNAKTRRIVDGRRKIYIELDGRIVPLGRRPSIQRVNRR